MLDEEWSENVSGVLLEGPSLEGDVVSEVSPEAGGGAGSGGCGQTASCAGKK